MSLKRQLTIFFSNMSNNNKQLHKKDKSFDASFASGPLILAEASKNLSVSKYAGKILHAGYVTMETINKKFWQKAWTKKYLVLTQSALDVFPDMEVCCDITVIVYIFLLGDS